MKKEQHHIKKTIFFIVTSILMTIYLLWRTFFTLPFQEGILQVIFGILLIVAETVTVFTTFELYYRKIKSDHYQLDLPDIQTEDFPDIDIFIATHNENCDLLYKTANACTYMDYPDTNKVHIYFCDDGNRNEVHELAKSLNIGYLGLADNKEAKSGNLNNALEHTNSPLVATGSVKNQHFDTNTTTLIYLYLSLSCFPFLYTKRDEHNILSTTKN